MFFHRSRIVSYYYTLLHYDNIFLYDLHAKNCYFYRNSYSSPYHFFIWHPPQNDCIRIPICITSCITDLIWTDHNTSSANHKTHGFCQPATAISPLRLLFHPLVLIPGRCSHRTMFFSPKHHISWKGIQTPSLCPWTVLKHYWSFLF